jgi:EmrB/QacA subfamily drug resistance transporter
LTIASHPQNKWLVFSLVAIAVFMTTLDSSIVNIALPTIMKNFQVTLTTIQWVVIIYLLTISSLLLAFGRLSDIKGRRWVYCRGFFIFSLGSLLCAIASNAFWLIAARSLQGIGAAMLMSCSPALVVDIFPAAERGRALGMVGTIVASGLTVGPALGGIILDLFSWRIIFYINIPIGIISMILAAKVLKGGAGDFARQEKFDWPGAILMMSCICFFLLALTRLDHWGYGTMRTVVFFSISAVCIVGFIRTELHTSHPIFDPALMKIRLFTLPTLSATIIFMSLFTIIFLMPFYLMHPAGFSVDRVGYMMVTPFILFFFVSPISGAISDQIGSRFLCTLGMVVLSIALFSFSFLSAQSPVYSIIWRLALAGIGIAIFLPPNSAVVLSAVPTNNRGVAAGTVATARNLGMVLGVAIAGLIFNSTFRAFSGGLYFKIYQPELESIFMTAFKYAMRAGGLIACFGIVVSFLRGSEPNHSGSQS